MKSWMKHLWDSCVKLCAAIGRSQSELMKWGYYHR